MRVIRLHRLLGTFRWDLLGYDLQDLASEVNVKAEKMGQQDFQELVELCDVEDISEKLSIEGFNSDSQWHFVLSTADAGLNDIIDNFLILKMLICFLGSFATLDILLNALIDQNLGKLIFGIFDIEFPGGFEGILQSLIIIV